MYDIDFTDKGQKKLHIRKFFLYPPNWVESNNQIAVNLGWRYVKFDRSNINLIPHRQGIYCFVVEPELANIFETRYLFYVGKTNRTLRIRFKEYLDDQRGIGKPRPKVYEMLNLYKDYLYFYFAAVEGAEEVQECEKKLLNTMVPHINTLIPDAKIKPELQYIYE